MGTSVGNVVMVAVFAIGAYMHDRFGLGLGLPFWASAVSTLLHLGRQHGHSQEPRRNSASGPIHLVSCRFLRVFDIHAGTPVTMRLL